MTIHAAFSEALIAIRLHGGMLVYHAAAGDDPEGWEVRDGGCRDTTEDALRAGGFNDAEVAAELRDFVPDP